MTNNPTTLLKAFLITSTALAIVPAVSTGALAQAASATQPPVATSQQPAPQEQTETPQENQPETSLEAAPVDQPAQPESDVAQEPADEADPTPGGPSQPESTEDISEIDPAAGLPAAREADELDPIVVTGSHIRGAVAAGANVQVFTSEDLERSGYATVHDFLSTIPQNFTGGGGGEDYSSGPLESSNLFQGSTVDLRGLGADSTLILINGRRVPPSGLNGNFTDVSNIPQSAIERIEILPDGASALYGSDAVGGVVNIILKKNFQGAETRLRYGRATGTNLDEYRAAQTFGTTWNTGRAILTYEYYHRDPLRYVERGFMATRDFRSRGGSDFRNDYANPGNILDPFTRQPAFAIPTGQDGRSLTVADLIPGAVNRDDISPSAEVLARQKRHSAFLSAEQDAMQSLTFFTELRYNERRGRRIAEPLTTTAFVPATNPFIVDPFGIIDPSGFGTIPVRFSFGEELLPRRDSKVKSGSALGGARLTLSSWRWETTASYSQEKSSQHSDALNSRAVRAALADPDPDTSLNVFGEGAVNNPLTLAGIVGENRYGANSKVINATSVIDGPLFNVKGRKLSFAAGADFRREKLSYATTTINGVTLSERLSRDIYAAFGEIYAPLVGPQDNIRFLRILDISAAVRFDKYENIGSTTNPKFGIRMSPINGLTLNSTYSTSYRAPHLVERSTAFNSTSIVPLSDPRSPTGFTETLLLAGNNPDMTSEQSETWTFGVTLQPVFAPGLTFQANYFATVFSDKISLPTPFLDSVLANDDRFSGIITRSPNADQINAICSDPTFVGDPANCNPDFVEAIIDFRLTNISRQVARGFDFTLTQSIPLGGYTLNIGGSATYLLEHSYQQDPTTPAEERVDTISNPVDFKARAYAALTARGLTGTITVNYTDAYENDISLVQDRIGSHTTVDLNVGLQFNNQLQLDANGRFGVNLNVVNLLAQDPPFADLATGYDGGHADPIGRLISIEIRANW